MTKAYLQQKRRQTDGCHHDQRNRTEECGATGVDHDQSQGDQQQGSREYRPAARLGVRERIRARIGQEIAVAEVIQAQSASFQTGKV